MYASPLAVYPDWWLLLSAFFLCLLLGCSTPLACSSLLRQLRRSKPVSRWVVALVNTWVSECTTPLFITSHVDKPKCLVRVGMCGVVAYDAMNAWNSWLLILPNAEWSSLIMSWKMNLWAYSSPIPAKMLQDMLLEFYVRNVGQQIYLKMVTKSKLNGDEETHPASQAGPTRWAGWGSTSPWTTSTPTSPPPMATMQCHALSTL